MDQPMLDIHGIEENRRALLNNLRQLIEEALQPFADDLREFLQRVRGGQFGSEWRGAWQTFVETQADAGFNIEADSVSRLVRLMESWEQQSPGARASEPTRIAIQSGGRSAPPDSRFMFASMKSKPKVRPGPSPPPRAPIPEVHKNAEGLEIAGPGPASHGLVSQEDAGGAGSSRRGRGPLVARQQCARRPALARRRLVSI
jgi:hypothetical protein